MAGIKKSDARLIEELEERGKSRKGSVEREGSGDVSRRFEVRRGSHEDGWICV